MRFVAALNAVVNPNNKHLFLEARTFPNIESENEKTGREI